MATITEDYVSFETAKLLKEKGFDWECIGYYVDDEPNDIKHSFCGETNSIWESRCCSAPTLQMAMKWLREKHNLFIQVTIVPHTTITMEQKYYLFSIHKDRRRLAFRENFSSECYFSYEQACEAAIKYCLENLI